MAAQPSQRVHTGGLDNVLLDLTLIKVHVLQQTILLLSAMSVNSDTVKPV